DPRRRPAGTHAGPCAHGRRRPLRPHRRAARGRDVRPRAAAVRGQGVRVAVVRLPAADGGAGRRVVARRPPPEREPAAAVGGLRVRRGAVPRRRHREHPRPLRRHHVVGRREPLRELAAARAGGRAHAPSCPGAAGLGAGSRCRGARGGAGGPLGARGVVDVHPPRHRARHGVHRHARRRGAGDARGRGGRRRPRPARARPGQSRPAGAV
ncbi:MAG: hypothetical protein AVDCRST_MAG24-703, partial [uncultured Nocardioidaceae bacterium]